MKAILDTTQLKDVLTRIYPVIDKKNSRPILTNFYLSIEKDKLCVQGTDLEVSSSIFIPCQSDEKRSICLNAKNFYDIIKELPEGDTLLELNEDNLLHIKNQQIHFSLPTLSSEDYPRLQFALGDDVLSIKGEELLKLINKTSFAMSSDETRIFLNGMYFQIIDESLRAVAIDGRKLALIDTPEFQGSSSILKDGVIIPKKAIYELKKLSEINPESSIKFSFDDAFVYFQNGDDFFMSIRLIAREYPKYQSIIPAKTVGVVYFNKDDLLSAVKRVKLLANEKTFGIKFLISNGEIKISAQHPVMGQAEETISVEYEGSEIEIGFNAKYVQDTLSVFDTDEIYFEFTNPLVPVVFKSAKEENYLSLVMPLKV